MNCEFCNNNIANSYVKYNDKAYHQQCYAQSVAPRCCYCGLALTNRYLVDAWGAAFCVAHKTTHPPCMFCGRLIPPQQVPPLSKNPRCIICKKTAIDLVEQARPIFNRLVQWFHSKELSCNHLQLQIELANREQIRSLDGGALGNHALGLTMQRVSGTGARQGVDKIAVLRGMPAVLFEGVASHELGHVWLAIQVKTCLPSWAEEGFCELVAYQRYNSLNSNESLYYAERTASNPDRIYGEGFRRVLAIERSIGFKQLVLYLQQTGRMPVM